MATPYAPILAPVLAGVTVSAVVSATAPTAQPWDATSYWTLMLLAAFVLGLLFRREPWRVGVLLAVSQLLVVLAVGGVDSLRALGLMLSVLSAAVFGLAAATGARLRSYS